MSLKVNEKIRLALFSTLKYPEYLYVKTEEDASGLGYIQISEYVEVVFPPRPEDVVISQQLVAIDAEILQIKEAAMREVEELSVRRQELLAISYSKST